MFLIIILLYKLQSQPHLIEADPIHYLVKYKILAQHTALLFVLLFYRADRYLPWNVDLGSQTERRSDTCGNGR